MLDKSFTDKMHKNFRDYFKQDSDILLAYLFGSTARNEDGPLSDVDIAVYLVAMNNSDMFSKKLTLLQHLSNMVPGKKVDLVVLNEAPIALKYHILKDGKLMCCSDENMEVTYKQRVISEYLDFKPVLDYLYRNLKQRIEEDRYAN